MEGIRGLLGKDHSGFSITNIEIQKRDEKTLSNDVPIVDAQGKLRNQVVKAECLKFMRDLPSDVIDCTITSPPYNKGAAMCYNTYDDGVPWDEYKARQVAVLKELYRITRPGGHLWYVHKVQHYDTNILHPVEWISQSPWTIQNEITWNKRSTINCNPYRFRPLDERIYWLHKPGPKEVELNPEISKWGSVWFTPDDRNAIRHTFRHPATFSIFLVLAILHAMNLKPGSLIFDPYGGTGTTAKASQVSNHYYLTTDIDREYVKIMKHRLKITPQADEYFILLVLKQIMTNSLDLSRNLRLPELYRLLQGEPWDLPQLRSEAEVQEEIKRRYKARKEVYYRVNPKPRSKIPRKYANCSYSNSKKLELKTMCRYVVKNPLKRTNHKNLWCARFRISKGFGKLKLKHVRIQKRRSYRKSRSHRYY